MKKAIIFDLDGTLWDSSKEVAEAWDQVTSSLKTPFRITYQKMEETMGLPMIEIGKRLFSAYVKEEEIPSLLIRCEEYENEYLLTHKGKLFPKVRETLEKLSSLYPLYIVSNCQKGYIETFLKSMDLEAYFSSFLCYGDTLAKKSGTIKTLLKRENITKAFYVGDTLGDKEAATEASLPFVFASYGFGEVEEYIAKITSFEELVPLAKELLKD